MRRVWCESWKCIWHLPKRGQRRGSHHKFPEKESNCPVLGDPANTTTAMQRQPPQLNPRCVTRRHPAIGRMCSFHSVTSPSDDHPKSRPKTSAGKRAATRCLTCGAHSPVRYPTQTVCSHTFVDPITAAHPEPVPERPASPTPGVSAWQPASINKGSHKIHEAVCAKQSVLLRLTNGPGMVQTQAA
ncbi:hypothetical protein N658DRAFT_94611 [Parathielavia hyrcaniae]|uniref:Uncharacterized protein n=1 Tax=Parathielavia hyrcaniae TaxID=113614 RepID=A0AAN6T0N0_9PEZI|nr:hypothetical protein N658DRAFT_94611 [Parathielavia hyrcaniae]